MYEGSMVEELIALVERVEKQSRPARETDVVAAEYFPAFSTYVYEWQGLAG